MRAADTDGQSRLVIAPVAALLLSVVLLVLGNGLQGTLLVVRAGHEGFRAEAIGAMMSAYFAGYALGSVLLPRMVVAAGHIRTFAGFASIASAVVLLHLMQLDVWVWALLRVATGFAYAGMILVTESWLNAHAARSTRGRLLSIYGMSTMGAWAAGQGLLNLAPAEGIFLFLAVSVLISLALVPITLLPSRPPTIGQQARLELPRLFAISPLGTLGAFASGAALGAFWGMGPNFAQEVGLDTAGISSFMTAVLLGALALQWPLGWLSDRGSRRLVIALACLGAALAGLGLALSGEAARLSSLLLLGFLFGGFGIPLYSLCVAHANDRLAPEEVLAAARGLILLNGLGAAVGPLAASVAMTWLGPAGLFLYAAALLLLLMLAALLRRLQGPQETPTLQPLPHSPLICMSLDTRSDEQREQQA